MFNLNLKKYTFLFYFLLIIGTSLLIYNYRSIENFFHLTKIKVFTQVYERYLVTFGSEHKLEMLDCGGKKVAYQKDDPRIGRNPQFIVGYTNKFLYTNGENITVHYAGDLLLTGDKVEKIIISDLVDDSIKYAHTFENPLPLKQQECHSFFGKGCNFENSFHIPSSTLGIGEYRLILISNNDEKSHAIYFNVRGNEITTSDPKIVVMFPNHTWQAYNMEGGGNFYGIRSGSASCQTHDSAFSVSIDRPLVNDTGHHSASYAIPFLKALKDAGIAYRTTSNSDLHYHPEVLSRAKILICFGHDEYWTRNMSDAIYNFVKKGGNLANFSGNIAWWHVNLLGSNIYCNKNYKNQHHENIRFRNSGESYLSPENLFPEKLFGISFEYGGYTVEDMSPTFEDAKKVGCSKEIYEDRQNITTLKPQHHVFVGTHLKYGDKWNGGSKVIGNELDGAPLDASNSIKEKYKANLPGKLDILAYGYAQLSSKSPVEKIGIVVEYTPFPGGGKAISFGSITYGEAITHNDGIAKKIFLNTIRYLGPKIFRPSINND